MRPKSLSCGFEMREGFLPLSDLCFAPAPFAKPSLAPANPGSRKRPTALLPCGAAAKGATGFPSGRRHGSTRGGPRKRATLLAIDRRGAEPPGRQHGGFSHSPAPGCSAYLQPR
jgi:hypothetical protein